MREWCTSCEGVLSSLIKKELRFERGAARDCPGAPVREWCMFYEGALLSLLKKELRFERGASRDCPGAPVREWCTFSHWGGGLSERF